MIKIICVGKIKEIFFKEMIEEYRKRISKYCKIEIIELPDLDYDINKSLKEEYNNIMRVYNNRDFNILLDVHGREIDSIEFSHLLSDTFIKNGNITFIIGGSYGVYEELKGKCNLSLSFSKMTFPHQLFRCILLEQIYRSFKIINNEEYHK